MQKEKCIQTLIEQTRKNIHQVEQLKNLDLSSLNWRENQKSWSILECLQHLNLYGQFYLPQMATKIKNSKASNESTFKSGILGAYFAKSMLPKENAKKMKTFKAMNPLNSSLDKRVIDTFLKQQMELLELLHLSKKVSWNSVKIKTSISPLLRLKLGDTFQFFSNHIVRHLKQVERIEINKENS